MISYVKYCVQYSTVLEIMYHTPTLSGGKEKAFFIIDPLTLPPVQLPWPARVSKWKDDLPAQERKWILRKDCFLQQGSKT